MISIKSFTFNSFEENTYVLYDETGECVVIDPGCHLKDEEEELANFISVNNLNPVKLLNTHCHIDHILGNYFVSKKFNLLPEYHRDETRVLESSGYVSQLYQIHLKPSPVAVRFLNEGDTVKFGNSELSVIFTPGHSPGSVTFFNQKEKFMISGDVLFMQSIGRTDLPGGSYEVLMESIIGKLLPLGDEVKVYSGHGPVTTIGAERKLNPFLREHLQH
jgi:glyoxylase-like metal-dependent hydrolase (beta-lactamase superfamily II)